MLNRKESDRVSFPANLTRTLCLLALAALLPGLAALPAFSAVWTVSTASQLDNAWRNAAAGDEIVVNSGTYNLISAVVLRVNNLTLRGATGNRDNVVLVGGGMNTQGVNEGIVVESDFVTVKDLTVKDFYWNGIHVRAENDADSTVIRNVKTWNIGERHIKGSRNPSDFNGVSDNLLIENCPQHGLQRNGFLFSDHLDHRLRSEPGQHRGRVAGQQRHSRGALYLDL